MSSARGEQAGFSWDEPEAPSGPAALPTPPLRLRRVHLRGVGPDGARFDPLDLDFTARDGAASRVLLSLTNTGGKSTLITLVSSLVVPAARAQVGGKNLGDYVLTGDTSHVICEWEDATSRSRTVTGTVMEWRDGRRQPGHKQRSTTQMRRAWYLFRTGPGDYGVDDLPFVTDGRRTTFEAFVGQVSSALSARPRAQWAMTQTQQEWTETLERLTSIDPVLFGYQMRMNDSEAGAEKLLATFDSPDNVIRFFVAALNDDRELADFTSTLAPYAALAVQRPGLEALAEFGARIGPRVEIVGARAGAAEEAGGHTVRLRLAGGEHAAALDNRVDRDRRSLTELERSAQAAVVALQSARREYGQISDIRLQLLLEDARARLASAGETVERTTAVARAAAAQADAWEAVDLVLDIAQARTARDAAQAAYDAADAGLEPLRAGARDAKAALAGRLQALADEALSSARTADTEAKAADDAAEQAVTRRTDAGRRADDAKRQLATIDEERAAARTATSAAVTAGWLHDGERPQLCQRRWADAVMSAEEQATAWDKAADDAEKAHQAAVTALDALDRRLGGLRAEAADAERTLRDFDDDVAGLAAHETLRVLVDEGLRGTDEVARAAAAADAAARSADLRAAEQERLAAEASAELTHLDGTGTAPAGADALAVLAALVDAHVGAVTGLEWIEHNVVDADARPAFIAANAELAGGVVVLDAARFDAAASSLATSELVTRTPVTVVTVPQSAAAEAALTPDESRRHVVLPHRATWDRAWARTRRDELETVRSAAAAAAGMARAAASDHRRAAAAGQQFVARWPGADRDELARRSRTAADEVNAAEGQQETLRADRDGHLAQAADARQQRDDARARGVTAHANEQAAQRLMTVCTQADQAAERRPAAERDRQRALRDADDAQEAERSARTRSKAATELAARTRASRDPWLRERAELGVDVAAPDPGGSLEVVRRGWTALRDELHDAERGLVEAGVLERAGRHLGELQARLPRHTPAAIERAEVLAGTIEASSAELRTAAQRQARRDASTAESDQLRAESDQRAAAATERSARPADRPNHVDLANVPEWRPADPANIFAILERLEIRNAELLAAREAAERAETDARELHDLVAADVSALADTSAMWTADKPPTVALFDATKDAARTRMRDLIATLNSAEKAERQARDALRDAVADTRAAVADPRWRDLDAPVAIRLRSLRDGELVTEATALTRKIDIMTRSARGDLDSLDTHRTVIRDGLVSLCRDQRRLLREVSRSSRLPDGLGELSLRPAVKILFDEAPADAAVAKLSQRVDAWAVELATNPKRASSSEVRARWLADAVRDTVIDRPKAGPWTVEILKPRIDGKVLYCPPDRIPHEFSGGQVLTLAVLVYCALSGVRSAHRPGGARPPGTLILDNPFGAASAEALIAMQHRLAAHTGLQLVCATGLNDAGVDAAFTGPGSVIVKLRNDGDLRRNLSFLRLRATVVDGIDIATALTSGRDVDAQRNWVDASAYRIGG